MSKNASHAVPAPPPRTIVEVDLGGLNRGGIHAINTVAAMNAASPSVELRLRGIDPNPNAIHHAQVAASERGLRLVSVRGRVEDVCADDGAAAAARPMILATDDAHADADGLLLAAEHGRAALVYLLIRLPTTALVGLTAVLAKADTELKVALAAFLAALGEATVRKGARAVLGDQALPAHVFLEPHFRLLFREHLVENLQRLAWDLEAEAAPIEVSYDGETRLPLVIVDSRSGWRDAAALAQEVLARPLVAIEPGKDLCIGEVGPDGIRLHLTRYRALDRAISVHGTTVVDAAALEEALRRAERQTINRTYPVYTTD
jgi:hypothetical protein